MPSSSFARLSRATLGSGLLSVAICLAFTRPASAYCQARSCDPDAVGGETCQLDPNTHCSVDGILLHRPSGCINIGIKRGSGQGIGLSDAELEQIILQGFEEWTSIDCGGGAHPSIVVQSVGAVDAQRPFACKSVPDLNLDVWMLADKLNGSDVVTPTTGATAGVTHPSFIVDTGEIFDADVELNELWLLVQDEDALRGNLRTVAAHEAGHVLGLAHSKQKDALMFRNYAVTANRKPTLDDARGICDLFPPMDLECAPPKVESAALDQNACNEAYLSLQSESTAPEAAPSCTLAFRSHEAGTSFGVPLLALVILGARRCRR